MTWITFGATPGSRFVVLWNACIETDDSNSSRLVAGKVQLTLGKVFGL